MKRTIARMVLGAALALPAFGLAGAQGATLNGCMATAAEPAMALNCSYIAGSAGQFVNTTRAHFTIQVIRDGAVTQRIEGQWGFPVSGTIATLSGDEVVVQVDSFGPCASVTPPLNLPPYPDAYSICPMTGAVSAGDR